MRFSLKINLKTGYFISLALLIASAFASYQSISSLLVSQGWVNHTNAIISNVQEIMFLLKDAESGQRAYLISGNPEFLESYNNVSKKVDELLNDTKQLTIDNPLQQQAIPQLKSLVNKRLSAMQVALNQKNAGMPFSAIDLKAGNSYMNDVAKQAEVIETREQSLLASRTEELNKFIHSTPLFIIAANLIAIIITLIFFFKLNRDLEARKALQQKLLVTNELTLKRIKSLEMIAGRITSGDYKARMSDDGEDVLGNVSGFLNKMAASLEGSFENLSDNEWLQKGIAQLNEKILGEKNMEVLCHNLLKFIMEYSGAITGTLYLKKDETTLVAAAVIGLEKNLVKNIINYGEGVAGQAAITHRTVMLNNITDTNFIINYAAGKLKPAVILAQPAIFEGFLAGVIEISFLSDFKAVVKDFINAASHTTGVAIHSAQDYQLLQSLLQETQSQSEELQMQHAELENTNTELEAQSQKLQVSEEELKMQQEELQQANQELEERSRLLEEKNEQIMERNQQILEKARELELSTKYKSEFLANMSHELRTPLNSILLLSRLLSENHNHTLNNDQVEYANVIHNSGKGLLTLINEILDLSKIEAGKSELEFSEFRITDVTNSLRSMFKPLAKDKNIEFSIILSDNIPEKIESDPLRLEQVLRNLISNALKFTRKGSVTLSVNGDNSFITFLIKDTGIGISLSQQQSVFEPFKQADGSTRREFGGTGLGLSISRQVVTLMGGNIVVKSEENKGSEFSFSIPVRKKNINAQPQQATVQPVALPAQLTVATGNLTAPVMSNMLADDRDNIQPKEKVILIVEDDVILAKALMDYMRSSQYKVIVTVRGDEAVALAEKYTPGGILLDIQLPVKNGWDVLAELKNNLLTRIIPVHIMSSSEVRSKSISAGATDFISKPLGTMAMNDVLQKIESAFRQPSEKVLIIEENYRHAQALSYYLETNNIIPDITTSLESSIHALQNEKLNCVIFETAAGIAELTDMLKQVKETAAFKNIPVIVFTTKTLSGSEEIRIKQYADSIVVKTAQSYQRILDEIFLFLQIVEENKKEKKFTGFKKLGALADVLQNKTVLIADDDVRNIFSLTKSLEQFGMHIVSSMDGKDALMQLEKNKPDVVLMDMMMPEMDGYESIMLIRENVHYKNLPIIAVTAKAMSGDRDKCISAGASDYITKPVDIDQLTSLLRVWLYQS